MGWFFLLLSLLLNIFIVYFQGFYYFYYFTVFYFFLFISFLLNVFQQSCFLKKLLHVIFYPSMEILGCASGCFTFRLSLITNWNIKELRYPLKRRFILTKWGYCSRQNLPVLWQTLLTSLGDIIDEKKTISTCCNNSRQQLSLSDVNNNHYVINTFPHLT